MLSLLELSLTGGVFILAVVVVRALAMNRLPRQAFLLLWAVALARLLLPFSIPSPTSLYSAAGHLGEGFRRAGIVTAGGTDAAGAAAQEAVIPWMALLWAAGALACALCFLLPHLRGRREWNASLPVEDPFVTAWLAGHPIRRKVRVRCSDRVDSPLTYGLLRPVILLPKTLDRSDVSRLAFVLTHEMAHIRRFDALSKLLLAAAACLHWFNPLVWWMAREAGRTLELCCDARVVRGRDEAFRRRYGTALLHLAAGGRGPVLSTRFGGGGRLLRARLANLFQHRRRGAAAAGLVLAAALAVTSLAACEQRLLTAEEAMDALEESIEVREYDIGPGELEYCISFRLPEHSGPEEEWNLHIAGRAETEALGGISLHYFDGEDWTAEKTYGIYLSPGQAADLTELTMEVWPPHGGRTGTYDAALHGRSIDLRALLREHFYVDARGFSLALPEPWPDLGAVQALDGGGLLLYCRALGPECGGIAQLHIETEPLEVLTGRDTLLGGREGCWLYLYGLQAPLPSLREAGEGVQEQYHALYQALYADPEELLSLWAEG